MWQYDQYMLSLLCHEWCIYLIAVHMDCFCDLLLVLTRIVDMYRLWPVDTTPQSRNQVPAMRKHRSQADRASNRGGRLPLRLVVVSGLVLVLPLAGILLYSMLARRGADRPEMMCVTPACGFQSSRKMAIGDVPPLTCPRCGRRSVYGTHTCRHCGTGVVLNRQRGVDLPTYCPRCGREVNRGE